VANATIDVEAKDSELRARGQHGAETLKRLGNGGKLGAANAANGDVNFVHGWPRRL
jgi:hypothetical protein